jgi:hypothetical protein
MACRTVSGRQILDEAFRGEAPWRCAFCANGFYATPSQPTLDPRYRLDRCATCRRTTIMERRDGPRGPLGDPVPR